MDVVEAIRTRRMLPRVTDERPTREDIEDLLELAVRAPVHHLTSPWRFHVLAGEGRDLLAKAIAQEAAEASGSTVEEQLETARAKVARAPVIVVVTCVPSTDPKVVEQEEFASVAMAMENILLAAPAKGLGVMLRTGSVAYHKAATTHLGLEENERVAGFLYIGRPAADRQPTPREPVAGHTRWVGWDA